MPITEKQLTFTNTDLLKTVRSATVEGRWITTTDNKKMLVWIIYPPDFNPNRKYPTLLFCEGGPQNDGEPVLLLQMEFPADGCQ